MKQIIDFTTITACGECCTDCPKKIKGLCKGCIATDGYVPEWAASGRCKVHECAKNHNVQFCGICDEFPCKQLTSIIHWNSDIVEHLTALAKKYYKQENLTKTISEFDEWIKNGLDKAEEIIHKSDTENIKQ